MSRLCTDEALCGARRGPLHRRDDDLCRSGFHATPERPDTGAHHVGRDDRVKRDLQEANPGLAAAMRLLVCCQDAAAEPEVPKHVGPVRVRPLPDLCSTVELDGWRRE